jgi:hypothetical protein
MLNMGVRIDANAEGISSSDTFCEDWTTGAGVVGVGVGDAVTGAGVGDEGVAVAGVDCTSANSSVGVGVSVSVGVLLGVTGAGVAVMMTTLGVSVAPKAVLIVMTLKVSKPNRIITAQAKPKIMPIKIH